MWRLVLIFALALPRLAIAQLSSVAERYLLAALNEERTRRGLAPVRIDRALQQAATLHADRMAAHRGISHQFSGEPELAERASAAGAHFARVTENVAEGLSAVILHDAWMHSPGHRANILDPLVDAVGIAVLVSRGQLYAVEDFQATVTDLTLEQQEAAVGLLLDAAGVELVPSAAARQTCSMETGYAGEERPSFVMRYTTGDLSQLPGKLQQRLVAGREHRAAVGACSAIDQGPFTAYSLAIVLYP